MPAYTLDSPAREVIEGCRKVVVANGDGLDGCYWAERGLEVVGRRKMTFREICDHHEPDMQMMVAQVLILPYLQVLFDREAKLHIASVAARHPRAAAWLLHLYGDKLPGDVKAEAEKNAIWYWRRGLEQSKFAERVGAGRVL